MNTLTQPDFHDLADELFEMWSYVEQDEVTESDIAELFQGVPIDNMRRVLRESENVGYQQAAAVGPVALGAYEALPELQAARRSDDEWLYELAEWGCWRLDQWHGLTLLLEAIGMFAEMQIGTEYQPSLL